MKAPDAYDGVVHGVEGRSAPSLSLDADPSGAAAVLVDAVEAVLPDHDHRVPPLGLCEHRVQI